MPTMRLSLLLHIDLYFSLLFFFIIISSIKKNSDEENDEREKIFSKQRHLRNAFF